MNTEDLAELPGLEAVWRRLNVDPAASWVLFHHGTCVLFPDPPPEEHLAEHAVDLLAAHGPVTIGTPSADFRVLPRDPSVPGWLVACHHPAILTHVETTDVTPGAGDLEVGLCGRSKRHMDGTELTVTHIHAARHPHPGPVPPPRPTPASNHPVTCAHPPGDAPVNHPRAVPANRGAKPA